MGGKGKSVDLAETEINFFFIWRKSESAKTGKV